MRIPLLLVLALLTASPAFAEETRESSGGAAPVAPQKPPAEMRADRLDGLFARLRMARDEDEAKKAEEAIWKLWTTSDSPTAEVLLGQASAAMAAKQYDASLEILNSLVEVHPDFAEAWNRRATLYFHLGRNRESLADIETVLNLEPRHFGALSGKGAIHQKEKNFSAAMKAFRDALAVNPTMESIKRAIKQIEKFEREI